MFRRLFSVRYFSSANRWLNNTSSSVAPIDPSIVEFTVGRVAQVDIHPDADSLYVSKIEIGDNIEPRTVCSGLVGKIAKENFHGSHVVLVTNLKPSKLRGVMSEAMVLAASDNEAVELVNPPINCKAGERLQFAGYGFDQAKKSLKLKQWQAIQPKIFVDNSRRVIFRSDDGTEHLLTSKDRLSDPASLKILKNVQVK